MSDLIKTVTILYQVGESNTYRSPVGDDDDPYPYHLVNVDPHVWADLGHPDRITVTIEPGDRLNEQGAST